jgi:hypothetical protein
MLEGMGRACQVCRHPRLTDIHEALLSGVPRREVARRFGLERSAVDRHFKMHIPDAVRAAAQQAGPVRMSVIDGGVLLGQAAEVYERAVDLFDRLEEQLSTGAVDTRSVVAALREQRQALETLAKLNYVVADRPQAPEKVEAPAIDAAIVAALEARRIAVDRVEESAPSPAPPRALPPPDTP